MVLSVILAISVLFFTNHASGEICGLVDCSYWGGRAAYDELKADILNRQDHNDVCGGYLCIELGLTKEEWLRRNENVDRTSGNRCIVLIRPGVYVQCQAEYDRNSQRDSDFWRDAELRCGRNRVNHDGTCNSGPLDGSTTTPGTVPRGNGSNGTTNSTAVPQETQRTQPRGGCLIATAALGTEMIRDVQNLREIRQRIYDGPAGGLMAGVNTAYYSFSPHIADAQRQSPLLNRAVQYMISPMMWSFSLIEPDKTTSDTQLMAQLWLVSSLNAWVYVFTPVLAIIFTRHRIKILR